jgi:hypothetical protein
MDMLSVRIKDYVIAQLENVNALPDTMVRRASVHHVRAMDYKQRAFQIQIKFSSTSKALTQTLVLSLVANRLQIFKRANVRVMECVNQLKKSQQVILAIFMISGIKIFRWVAFVIQGMSYFVIILSTLVLSSHESFLFLCRYGDADCSQRQCKYGVDPLWIDDTTIRVTETVVRIKSDLAGAGTLAGKYALRFFDVFGDDHVTEPLDLTPTGSGHCADVVNALLGLPNHVVPSVECSDLTVINTNEGFEYTLKFTGNPGELRELEIVEHLDGNRPTIEVTSGATYAANVYTKVKGEFVDYFAEKCEGVTLKVVVDSDDSTNVFNVDVKPGSIGYLEIPTVAEENLLKVCLGHADDDPNNNHDIQNWDKGVVTESDGSPPVAVKMIGAFPHAIKVVPKEDTLGYDQFSKGSYHLVWYDEGASTGKKFRVANVNNNHNQPSEAVDSYVYTTKGNVQQLGYGTEVTEMLADNTDALSTSDRIVAYFDAYTNKLHTNFDTSCENQPSSPNARNHKCLEKGDKLFIIDSCWGKGNAAVAPMETNPFFGGKETTSCTDSNSLNHNTGNLYTVKKVCRSFIILNRMSWFNNSNPSYVSTRIDLYRTKTI